MLLLFTAHIRDLNLPGDVYAPKGLKEDNVWKATRSDSFCSSGPLMRFYQCREV